MRKSKRKHYRKSSPSVPWGSTDSENPGALLKIP